MKDWNALRRDIQREAKAALVKFISDNCINEHGLIVQFGTGSLQIMIAEDLIRRQQESGCPMDLTILTNNEAIAQLVRAAKEESPSTFANTQLTISGGNFNKGLNAYHGRWAAEGIRWHEITPDVTVVTAFGLTFSRGDVCLTYKFEEELQTQEALATRPTSHRIILADSTKVGKSSDHRASVTLKSMIANARKCTFVFSGPAQLTPDVSAQIDAFLGMLTSIVVQERKAFREHSDAIAETDVYYGKEIALFLVDEKTGITMRSWSLEAMRKEAQFDDTDDSRDPPASEEWKSLTPESTQWFDSSGEGPFAFREVLEWCTLGGADPTMFHLASYLSRNYVSFADYLQVSTKLNGMLVPR